MNPNRLSEESLASWSTRHAFHGEARRVSLILVPLALFALASRAHAADVCLAPPDGLVAWWAGDGDASDFVGSNDGTLYGGATFAPGKVGQGFKLDGVDDFVLIPDSSTLNLTNALTVELWFNSDEWASDKSYALIDKRTWTTCNYGVIVSQQWGFQLYYNDPNVFGGDYGGNDFEISAYFPLPTPGVFHHFAGTFRQVDDGQIELNTFFDGELAQARTFEGRLANTVNDMALAIGAARGGVGEFFRGVIDEVSLYNRALSASEIRSIYEAGEAGKCKTPFPPQIRSQPRSQTVYLGETAVFAVSASGTGPLSYQWQFNGGVLAGASEASLAVTNAQASDSGDYRVVVSNTSGSVTSVVATLTVNTNPPVCVAPPAGLIAWWTGDGTASDLLGLNPAELHNGASFAPGKVGQGFKLDGVDDFVLVPDDVTLRLTNELTFELWFKAESSTWGGLIDKRGDIRGANYGLIISSDYGVQLYYNDPVVFGGDHPGNIFEIAAHFPLPTLNEFHHFAGTFRQVGADNIALEMYIDGALVESRLFSGNLARTLNNAPLAIGAVSGTCCYFRGIIDEISLYNRALSGFEIQGIFSSGAAGKCKNIPPTAPQILLQPQNQTVYVGETAEFKVAARGTRPLSYQWQLNGQSVAGAIDAGLTVTNAQASDGGDYRVVVSNTAGSVTSIVATLTVNTDPPACVVPPAGLVAWWTGDQTAGDLVGNNHGQLQNGASFAPGKVGQGFKLDGVDDFVLIPDSSTLNLTNALTVELWFNSDEWASDKSYALIDKRTWMTCNYGVIVSQQWGFQLYYNDPNVFGGDYAGNLFEISAYFPLPTPGVFHHFAGTFRQVDDGHIELNTFFDGELAQARTFEGRLANTVNDMALAIGSARGGVGEFFKGVIDEVSLYNRALTGSEIQAIFRANRAGKCKEGFAPRIAHQPVDAIAMPGATAAFSVDAVGSEPLTYEWSFNGTPIPGANSPVLNIANVGITDAGAYSVVVSNAYGFDASTAAKLIVDTNPPPRVVAPEIVSQPTNLTVIEGSTATFSVAATGTAPLSYRWLFNGLELAGATEAVLTLRAVELRQAGLYSVRISNAADSITSEAARLVVRPNTNPPAITRQPANLTVQPGGTATFSVLATGAPPLSYQWRYNNVDLPGATNNTLSLPNVQLSQAGEYSSVASNPFGSTLSAGAILAVAETFVPGFIYFANLAHETNSLNSVDAPIFDVDGITKIAGDQFRALLAAGPTIGSMAAMGPIAEFQTGSAAGYFESKTVATTNVPAGQTAYVQVRVWDQATGATYELAQAYGGKYGASPIFQVETGGAGSPPSRPALLTGLQSFSLNQGVAASLQTSVITAGQKLLDGSQEWIVKAPSGFRYAIQCSSNLVDWVAVTIVLPVNGTATFANPPDAPCNYFRVLLLP